MKRFLIILFAFGMLFSLSMPAFASSDVTINANGKVLKDAQAVIQNGSTLLPVRSVSTALGSEVDWDGESKTATIEKGDTLITILVGDDKLTVNGEAQAISAPAQIIDGRTYVPLRALGEALNCDIQWVNDTKTVEITPNDPAEYKAWYEIDESGNLYIKTNISSRKWDGYSTIMILNHRNGSSWDEHFGDGIVRYSPRAFISHRDINTVIDSAEFYIFKGIHKEISDNAKNIDVEDIISSLSDQIIYKVTFDNTIYIKSSGETIAIDAIKLSIENQREIYTVSAVEQLPSYGMYDIHLSVPPREIYGSTLKKKKDVLICNIESGYFPINEKSGEFYISHAIYSMDGNGNITLSKTASNRIDGSAVLQE